MRPKRSHPIRSTSSNTSSPSIRPRFRSGRNSANAAAPTIRPKCATRSCRGGTGATSSPPTTTSFDRHVSEDTTANGSDDATPDSVYAHRLQQLVSPVQLPYNPIVRGYIARYTNPRYGTISRILGMSQYYFPLIEEELIKAGLPVELRALPIIESALNPTAVSRMGAAGLWQFMPSTGKLYGLEVNSLIDERYDPVLATRAACRYLKDMYAVFGDWMLAIASYNCGPGNVNKAIARSGGGKTFWEIYDYLPRETRGYVPAFIGRLLRLRLP